MIRTILGLIMIGHGRHVGHGPAAVRGVLLVADGHASSPRHRLLARTGDLVSRGTSRHAVAR